MMHRRNFLAGAVLAPLVAAAQPKGKASRIGYLGITEQTGTPGLETFRDGMRSLGYAEGRDYVLEVRWGRGDPQRAQSLAAELVSLKVDLLLTGGSEATRAAKQATATIPIVFHGPSYPVEEGLVTTFARPGGNVTGITVAMSDTVSKHLQLLKDVVPELMDVMVIWSPANRGMTFALRDTERAAASMRVKVRSTPMETANDVDGALGAIERARPGALIVYPAAPVFAHLPRLNELAARLKLPTITNSRPLAEQGLLMAYGPDFRDTTRRLAGYADRILKGAKPAELPVERPTRFELVINMRTARAIGLVLPPSLVLRADEVIH